MNKYDKILLVRQLGLNTEDNMLVKSEDQLDEMWSFVGAELAISLRTMHPTDNHIKTPHYPFVLKQDIEARVREVLGSGFYGIVAHPINPEDAILAGAALIEDGKIHIELANGPCTVRRVTHDGIIDYMVIHPGPDPGRREIHEMIEELKKVPYQTCVVELSYYRIPVGYKQENVIIWDINILGGKW